MEKTLKFNSQVATSRVQSERLLALGLKKETADMHHYRWSEGYWDIQACPPRGDSSSFIPAWSLHRLIEMVAGGSEEQMIFLPDPYDELIEEIAGAIIVGCFPKEYLV